jgi:hypothetical protein
MKDSDAESEMDVPQLMPFRTRDIVVECSAERTPSPLESSASSFG